MKKYANEYGHSDIHPCRVVNTISSKTLEVQRMGSKLADDWKPDTKAGGFFGHTINILENMPKRFHDYNF